MNPTRFFLSTALLLVSAAPLAAQTMRAVTSSPGPGLHVVVTWPPSPTVARYNLYRRASAQAGFPATPLNSTPIQRMSSCAAIQAVIPPVSAEWALIAKGLADPGGPDFDPCQIATLPNGSPKLARLEFLARSRWRIAVVAGLAFDDTTVVNGTAYVYELRSVNALGTETGTVFTNVTVTAGSPTPVPAPPNVTATAGDHRVQLLWGDQPTAAGFTVSRATNPGGPFVRVNESFFLTKISTDLEGKPLASPSYGFVDIQRFNASGLPDTHLVNGVPVEGPFNGTTYFYRVASVDFLDQPGPPSANVTATPQDVTPPAVPTGISVKAVDSENRLEVRWNLVEFDADGQAEAAPLNGYRLFRFDAENAPLNTGVQIGGLIPPPPAGQTYVVASDNSPNLRPPFGETTFWYRAEAIDNRGNISSRSAAAGGHLKDITPPAPPAGVAAEGFDDFIRVRWNAKKEPDLDGYQIYRSLCHNGANIPCGEPTGTPAGPATGLLFPIDKPQRPCTGEYVLVGTVSLADALKMGSTIIFDDRSVPSGSPLCYSYWIKAIDKVQNRSGAWPWPDPVTEKTVCQRLRDKTPPDPAIISGLFARDQSVHIEWIGPPVQDIRAYHVYRAEMEKGPYKWVGGMTVEPPPALPVPLLKPYTPPAVVGCDKIPVATIDSMSMGFAIDASVRPKQIYWYKVVGIDQSGNEAPLDKAVPVSTFDFTTAQPTAPTITSVTGSSAAPFALTVRWDPAFSASQHRGFAVFKSDQVNGLYRQIGTLLSASEYQDTRVVRGVTYWYKVLVMDRTGQVSAPSAPVSGTLP